MQKAYLVLANEYVFEGYSFGAPITSIGELVFTTGMGGYIETLTDPSYNGQIVMQTFPLIGNYGIIEDDFEGECAIKGYVVRYPCATPSNFRTDYTLDEFLKKRNIPGLYGIDTREVTRIIREYGVVNAMITTELPTDFTPIKNYALVDAVKQVSTKESFTVTAENEQYKVALLDYGAKRNIIRELVKRGCSVTVLPYDTKTEDILALNPDGLMLSNGPGDPAENVVPIAESAKLSGKLPIFGICLGHQLLALAHGGETVKLKYGHRGVNQPVKEVSGTRTYITSQNHGYAVVSESLKSGKLSFINANDGTCEGIEYPEEQAFSVQFHPEACSGPKDTAFLFDKFIDLMKGAH